MKTVNDVKKALDCDLFIDMLPKMRQERDAKLKAKEKPKRHRNTWNDLFPACKGVRG